MKTFNDYSERDLKALIQFLTNLLERKFGASPVAHTKRPASFSEPDDADLEGARKAAQAYAEARNKNLRPVRLVTTSDQSVVEGQRSALEYLERRRRSKVRG